jgi:hypothetical protein
LGVLITLYQMHILCNTEHTPQRETAEIKLRRKRKKVIVAYIKNFPIILL